MRALFLLTAADTHPLVVPRVRAQLKQRFGVDDAAVAQWAAHWFQEGLAAYEALLPEGATRCHAETFSIADLALASHLIGAARFGVALDNYPRVAKVGASLMAIPEVAAAHPNMQIDAPQM